MITDIAYVLQAANSEAIAYSWNPSRGYVKAGIMLGRFIGDLFAQELLTPLNITACLNTVLQNVVSIEHLEAVQALITHAGYNYWHYNDEGAEGINRFRSVLVTLVNPLKREMAVVAERRPLRNGEIGNIVGDILTHCDKWVDLLLMAMHEQQQAQFMATPMHIGQYTNHDLYNHVLQH
jgi:hypothetical protein